MTYPIPRESSGSSSSLSPLRLASGSSPASQASSQPSCNEQIADEATTFARLLLDTENAIDGAFALAGQFAVSLTRLRQAKNLSAVVGQPIFDRAASALTAISTARGDMVDAHRLVAALAKQLNYDVTAYGDGQDKGKLGFAAACDISVQAA